MRTFDAMYDDRAAMRLEWLEDSPCSAPVLLDECIVFDSGTPAFEAPVLRSLIDEAARGRHEMCGHSRNSACYKIRADHVSYAGDVVLKQAVISSDRTNADSTFACEADCLKKLARLEIPGCPRLLARFMCRGRYYLLLTFVPGEHPDPQHVPLQKSVLRQIFDMFYRMDRDGFIHYDLQAPNIVVSLGRAGLIDFEFAAQVNPFSVKDESYLCDYNISSNPYIPLRSCVCNFEFRTLLPYLDRLRLLVSGENVLDFVRIYLDCKASYHVLMEQYFTSVADGYDAGFASVFRNDLSIEMLRRGADYERVLVEIYSRASAEILTTEYLILKLRYQLFERDFNGCCYDLPAGFSNANAKVLRFAGEAKNNQDDSASWYFKNSLELLRKLEGKALAGPDVRHC